MKEAHLHMGGRGRGASWGWVRPPQLFIKTEVWLCNNGWGLVIGKQPPERAFSPQRCCQICCCANRCTTPLSGAQSGKWVVGVEPLIISSRENRPPWGMRSVTLLSSPNKIFICYFFPALAGQRHSCTGRGACTSSLSSRADKDMPRATGQTWIYKPVF